MQLIVPGKRYNFALVESSVNCDTVYLAHDAVRLMKGGVMPDTERATDRSGVQVIARAAAILRVLRTVGNGLSLGQIAERVELPRSTVQRIVGALQRERLVTASGTGGIRLGPEIVLLSEGVGENTVEVCRKPLAALAQKLGETVDLSVLRGGQMVFLAQVPGTHRLRAVSSVGDTFPLTNTANGRAVLAMLDPAAAAEIARSEWAARRTVGDLSALEVDLNEIRSARFAYDIDEHTPGISAVGVAFADGAGTLHAISVPVPSTRFPGVRSDVERELANSLAEIRTALA